MLINIQRCLGCGTIFKIPEKSRVNFVVVKLTDITNIFIPIFNKYPLIGSKKLNFLDFCKVVEIMESGAHLTPKGLEEIRKIKASMNTGRDY